MKATKAVGSCRVVAISCGYTVSYICAASLVFTLFYLFSIPLLENRSYLYILSLIINYVSLTSSLLFKLADKVLLNDSKNRGRE